MPETLYSFVARTQKQRQRATLWSALCPKAERNVCPKENMELELRWEIKEMCRGRRGSETRELRASGSALAGSKIRPTHRCRLLGSREPEKGLISISDALTRRLFQAPPTDVCLHPPVEQRLPCTTPPLPFSVSFLLILSFCSTTGQSGISATGSEPHRFGGTPSYRLLCTLTFSQVLC